jgi:hypothetical protein
MSIGQLRTIAQRIVGSTCEDAAATVRHMLAVQAQDLAAAKWAVGLRTHGATLATIDAALAAGSIVRSWPMRGTLHFVAAEDLGWIMSLTAKRTIAMHAKRHRDLGLDARTVGRARDAALAALEPGPLARAKLLAAIAKRRITIDAPRSYHLLFLLAQDGAICVGPNDAWVRCDTWIKGARVYDRDEALGELAHRYFTSHGPATEHDLSVWAKLPLRDTRVGIELALPRLVKRGEYYQSPALALTAAAKTAVRVLPAFDELFIGYTERDELFEAKFASRIAPGGGVLRPMILSRGQIVGTWSRATSKRDVAITAAPFGKPVRGLAKAAAAYGTFVGTPVIVR